MSSVTFANQEHGGVSASNVPRLTVRIFRCLDGMGKPRFQLESLENSKGRGSWAVFCQPNGPEPS